MRKTERFLYKIIVIGALLFCGCFSLFAQKNLESFLISTADRDELEKMASLRGLSTTQVTDDELRDRLYLFDGLKRAEDTRNSDEAGKPEYTLNVLQSQWMQKKGKEKSLVSLLGSVKVSFLLKEDSKERKLSADKMLVDLDSTILSAMGSVSYHDDAPQAAVQQMEGDIITLDWHDSSLRVSNGTTKTERKNKDDESVTFYTTGDQITYNTREGGIFFDKGYITNNYQNAYSSITAKKLAMMDNGDMIISNAYLSIGRVPVFWVPFFLFPGSTMVGNPAIGQESERGWFVNTSFELYGTYPSIASSSNQSSFTRLMQADSDKERIPDGATYRKLKEGESLSFFQQWAKSSGSYMTLLADSYQNTGLSVGLATVNNLWSKELSVSADGKFAVSPSGSSTLSSYSSYPKTRYYLDSSLVLDTENIDLKFTFPLYSDPKVKRAFGNRFTAFSLDSLFGAEWPTDFSSDITSYTWSASGSFTLPKAWKTGFLDTFIVSTAKASAVYNWNMPTSMTEYGYHLYSVVIPELTAKIGGTLFDSTTINKKKDTSTDKEEKKYNDSQAELSSLLTTTNDDFVNKMLADAYRSKTESETKNEKGGYAKLYYTVDEKLSQSAKSVSNIFSWDSTHYLYNLTKAALTFDSVLDPDFFTFKQSVVPQYSYTEDKTKTIYKIKQFTVSANTYASVPLLGLSYSLSEKLYSYTESTTTSEETTIDEKYFKFTSSYVTTHQIALSKDFSLGSGTFSPSLTYILPPLTQSLIPAITYKISNWSFYGSFKFVQGDDALLHKNLLTATITFSSDYLNFSTKNTYQCTDYTASDFWYPFKSSGAVSFSRWGLTLSESYDYSAHSTSYYYYFNSLASSISYGFFKSTFTFLGPYDNLKKSTWATTIDISNFKINWWKQRCSLTFDLASTMTIDFITPYATNLSITAGFTFSIAEFLDLKFSVTSGNSGFFTYYEDDQFKWNLMFEDLLRSFDFFGDGRSQTNFNLSKLSFQLIHYMDDWTLNCKYTGSVVLSNNKYSWVPLVSVFLQWKTIPELKVDENWTKSTSSSAWTSSGSSDT